ncbi:MAG: hypothetical protein D4R81_07780 [Nitrospiraceae bacterium]|nr:MAG: hypothetical protein D4R81_07780 [Nitrospiraceae bacterium]
MLEDALSFGMYSQRPPANLTIGTFLHNFFSIFPLLSTATDTLLDSVAAPFSRYRFMNVTWVLNVEMVFYAVMFVALSVTCILPRYARAAFIFLIGVVVGESLLSASVPGQPFALRFAPFFLLGVVFYHREGMGRILGNWAVGTLLVLMLLQYSLYKQDSTVLSWQWVSGLMAWDVLVPILAVVVLVFVIEWLSKARVQEDNIRRLDKWLGDLSYPVYLNHHTLLVLTAAFASKQSTHSSLYWFIAILLVFLVSLAMKTLIELPLKRVRDRFRGRTL